MQFLIDFLGFLWSATNEMLQKFCNECLNITLMIMILFLILSVFLKIQLLLKTA
jgi:hypothetical protein